jgi:hypothetical protein
MQTRRMLVGRGANLRLTVAVPSDFISSLGFTTTRTGLFSIALNPTRWEKYKKSRFSVFSTAVRGRINVGQGRGPATSTLVV